MITSDGKIVLSDSEVRPRIAALIPFKGWNDRHSRLSFERGGILSYEERTQLAFFEVVDSFFTWSKGLGEYGDVYVGLHFDITDPTIRDNLTPITSRSVLPERYNGVVDLASRDINEAIRNFAHQVEGIGYNTLIVAGSDLPLLVIDDVKYLLSLAWGFMFQKQRIVFLSKARDGGTPVYLINPPTGYEIQLYREGYTNFENQVERLRKQNIPYHVIKDNVGLCVDLDTPYDFMRISRSCRKIPNIYDPTSGSHALWYIKKINHRRSTGDNNPVYAKQEMGGRAMRKK